jgi:hypothetical protein
MKLPSFSSPEGSHPPKPPTYLNTYRLREGRGEGEGEGKKGRGRGGGQVPNRFLFTVSAIPSQL